MPVTTQNADDVAVSGNSDDLTEGSTQLLLTLAERAKLTATSGTNTGDKDEYTTDVFRIKDTEDPTKLVAFDASAITTGTTRTITVPDAGVDLTKVNTAVQPNVATQFTAFQGITQATLTDAATIAWNLATAQNAKVTITANRTMGTPSNMAAGYVALTVVQGGAGSFTISWPTEFKFGDAGEPTLSTTVAKEDILQFYCTGSVLRFIGIVKGF